MKYIGLLFLVFMLGFQPGFAQKRTGKEHKAQKAIEIKTLIESGEYVFIARSATPLSGRKVDLTSEYNLKIKGDSVESWLPYFGRAYQASYGDTDGGIKFKQKVTELKTTCNEQKKRCEVSFVADTPQDTYRMQLSVGWSGYGNLSVTSNHRQTISYYGMLEAWPAEKEKN